ncbi:flagellar hook-associated protein 3 FlgL [Ferrimonas sediminum]|uniref:Flagellar hook-associated protein 3 FlgL n=1 Tax=Ferrimonas sediminum TaxID=718193 RepID=A0A1G9A0L6_9GAMM|nr:flagellar hook-associated protein FlgL [Ferrimonas sediminum]SDK20125.1 flagellar hook-associated protein 3 FlgL [Ferrimonas sediminum]
MRVSNQQLYLNNMYSMQNNSNNLGELLQKMAYGKSILKPSDDPIGAVQVMTVARDQAATSQYVDNIGALSDSLDRSESYLTSMIDVQNRMREIITATGNGSLSNEDRQAYADELTELQEAMVDMANAKDDKGNYIFSGNLTDTAPVTKDGSGNYVYSGDSNTREVQVSDSTWITANSSGDELFFNNASDDIFNALNDYIAVLEDPSLAPGNPAFDAQQSGMMSTLDDTLTSVSGVVTSIGGRQNSLELIQSSHTDMMLFNEQLMGEVSGLDYAEAQTEYENSLVAMKIAQQSYVKIAQLSLFNEM